MATFLLAAQICSISVGVLLLLTIIQWVRQTEWRFAFVGYTAFTAVLAVGLWALSWGPIIRTTVPGAARYTVVFDRGTTDVVIAVAPDVEPEALALGLQQAASNLYSSGRYSQDRGAIMTVRARTIIHPEPGISEVLQLGQVQRTLMQRNDPDMQIEIDEVAIARAQAMQS
ncbi:MAG: DUF2518 family protein [Synechococcaceae cyanobacterium SM2_3_60]|nr:DUF2518 family protein [Synechococcaceae cyanobacterium SM2_3_60]